VFHDDQHGTAVVVLAALENACRVVETRPADLRVVVLGAGAAGIACARLLLHAGVRDLVAVDLGGILPSRAGRRARSAALPADGAVQPARHHRRASRGPGRGRRLHRAEPAGGPAAGLGRHHGPQAIVFARANPVPEILPDEVPPNMASVFDRRIAPAVSWAVQETVERAGLSRLVESG
jgi:malate dehydrogenase (oxaloacetate-decarboxylating)